MIVKMTLALAAGLLGLTGLAAAADGPDDAEIAHIAYTAGVIDIAAGQQALHKSRNRTVRAFAQEMVRDHGAVNVQALALVRELGVTPRDNPTSKALSQAAGEEIRKLSSLNGAAFDRAYVSNEVSFHRTVNDALRKTLIPSAKNGKLRALLETGLSLFSEHQMHAEGLASKLG
jgi:putative membrane protein